MWKEWVKRTVALWGLPLLLLLSGDTSAQSTAAVWSVSKDGRQLFVGGTMHMLPQSEFPLPEPFDFAYRLASVLVFETDVQAFNDPAMQQRFADNMLLPNGQRLEEVVSAETYALLEEHLRQRGLPVQGFDHMRPEMVALAVTTLELQRLGLGEAGVDQHYLDRGNAEGKNVAWLEDTEDHLQYILNMAAGAEEEFLRYSLLDMSQLREFMEVMVSVWRSGDVEGMNEVFISQMQEDFPRLYASLLVERNNNWLPQIREYLKTPEIEFVLVGAAHLVGSDGILQQLEQSGYKVKQMRDTGG